MAPALWYLRAWKQTITADGFKIEAKTNTPAHLWLYWTLSPPWTHKIPVLRRGLNVREDIYICFDAWHKVEQEEAGDTEYHTFFVEPWPVCETRWFILQGTIDGLPSPSTTSIYKKHRFMPPIPTEWWVCGWPQASVWSIRVGYWFGQTFTPIEDRQLTKVSLAICKEPLYVPYYNTTYVRVYEAPGHIPTGAPLAETSYDPNDMPWKPNYQWSYFPISTVDVQAGKTYALTLAIYKDGDKRYGGDVSLGPVGVENCPGGHRIHTHNEGSSWEHEWNGNVSNKLIGF